MKKRVLSIVLAMALCLTLLPTAAWAEEPDAEPGGEQADTEQGVLSEAEPETEVWTVTAFDELAENVASQTLPQLVEDGEDEGPNLPDTLNATAYQVEDDTQPIIIEVTWEADSAFDQTIPGDYIYTPALPEGYALAEGVEPPAITVTVEAAPDPQDETPQDTAGETPTVEDVPVAHNAGEDDTAVNWANAADTSWYTNAEDGTTEFTISSAAQLAGLAKLVNEGTNFSGKTITLDKDVDLNGKEWTPIGKYTDNSWTDPAFQGTFNGNGKTVSGLCVNITATGKTSGGLFGNVNGGTVQNINVEGTVTVTSTSSIYVGGVVGYAGTGSTVENCSFSGDVTGSNRSTGVGGVVGYAYQATTIKNCFHSGTVTTESQYGGSAGGVVGYAGTGSTVENCGHTGKVSNTSDAGTSALSASIGGVVGHASGTTVNNCYNTGVVESTHNSPSQYSTSHNVGGVAGYAGRATVKNCYNTGTVTGTSTSTGAGTVSTSVGGVVGTNGDGTSSATVSNCYFLDGTASQGVGSGHSDSTSEKVENKDTDAFTSGEVAYLLSGGETQDETSPWRQNLGDAGDTAPTLDSTHAQVTQLGTAYANTSTGDDGTTCYLIYTAAQLNAFASAVNSGQTSINAKLMDDIDLSTVCGEGLGSWTPIGNTSSSNPNAYFQGTFDGQGHTVKGLYMNITRTGNYSTYGGLFGNVEGGTVKNLNVNGTVTVTTNGSNFVYVGGVVGYADGPSGALSTVENCSFAGEVTGTSGYSIYVGGVVGPADKATVRGCSNSGTVTANGQDYSYAGGVVGRAYDGTTVENCYNTGAVTGTGSDTFYVGGVAGYIYLTTTMKNCYNTGTVSGPSGGNVGGVVGGAGYAVNYPSTVENCYFLQTDEVNDGLSGIGYAASSSTTGQSSNDGAEAKNTSAFASGEVAYLLQADQETQYWGQTLGTDEVTYPVLTSDEDLSVVKVTFMVKAEGGYTEYDAKYANKDGTVALPADPTAPDTHAFCGWYISDTAFTEANRFTANTTVAADTTVYAGMQLQYGTAEGDKTVNTTYGAGATADLSECIAYADDETSAAKNFSYAIASGNTGNYFSISGDTLTVSKTTPASTYTLTITAKEQTPQIALLSTYSFGTSDVTFTVTVVVAKAAPTVTAPAANTLTYTGNAQTLVTAGSTTGGTLVYSTEENGTYSETIPMGTDAGAYTVYYKVEGDDNYNGVDAASVEVTIKKATPDALATPTAESVTYGVKLSNIVLATGWSWSDGNTVPTVTNSGYDATYKVEDYTNYDWSNVTGYDPGTHTVTRTVTVMVNRAASKVDTAPTAVQNIMYNGSAQELIIGGNATGGELVYSTEGNGEYSTTIPTGTKAGTYNVWYMVKGDDNHNDTTAASVTVTIAPKTAELEAPTAPNTVTYGATLSETGLTSGWSWLDGSTVPTVKNSGYDATYKVEDYTNYDWSNVNGYNSDTHTVTRTVTVTVNRAASSISAKPTAKTGLVYTGLQQDLVNAGGGVVGGTLEYSTDGTSYSTEIPTGKDAGDYTVWYKVEGDDNHSDTEPANVTVTIAKAAPTYSAPTAKGLTYTGEAQALVSAGSTEHGTVQYSTEANGTYSEDIPTGTDADTYTVYYKVVGDDNHTDTTTASVEVIIAKATPTYIAPTDVTAVRGQTLAGVKLPSGWAWVDGTLSAGNERAFEAIYTPDDTDNYNTVTVDITVTIVAEVEVKPGETVEIGDTTVTNNDDGTVTVKGEDGTEITVTLPEGSDSVTVDGDGNVTVPDGTTVKAGDTEITLPSGGTVDGDGNVTGEEVQIGDTTITAPEGETVTTTPDGTTTAPGGTTVQTGDGPEITLPDGGEVADDGSVTAETVQVGDTTITAPEGETVTTTPDGTTTAPGGTTVEVGDTTITIGEDTTGATVDENGSINLPSGGTVTLETGDGKTVIIEVPEDGTVSVDDDGKIVLPGGSTVTIGDHTTTIPAAGGNLNVSTGAVTVNSTDSGSNGSGSGGSSTPTYTLTVKQTDNGSVTVSPKSPKQGATVTITVTPDQGYEVDKVIVTDRNGDAIRVKDKGNGVYTFTMPASKVEVKVTFVETDTACDGGEDCPSCHFADVDSAAWYHLAVDYVVENGLMSGYGNGLFGPNDALSRAQLAQILYNQEGQPGVTGGSGFADVADGAWYGGAVTWAAANGIVTGYGNALFGPDDPITREQLAVMLWRYARSKGHDTTQGGMVIREFSDYESISGYAMDAMNWAVNTGVISGYEDQTLRPQANATRAQAAQMLKSFFENA